MLRDMFISLAIYNSLYVILFHVSLTLQINILAMILKGIRWQKEPIFISLFLQCMTMALAKFL